MRILIHWPLNFQGMHKGVNSGKISTMGHKKMKIVYFWAILDFKSAVKIAFRGVLGGLWALESITTLNSPKKISMNCGISREKLLQISTRTSGTNCERQNFLKITQKSNVILQHRTSKYIITSLNFSRKISTKFDCYK